MLPSPVPPEPAGLVAAVPTAEPFPDLRLAQAGDGAAFERIYRANAGRVYALALRLTADRQRADELVQDAFVRAWERLGSFRGESSFATWLHRLTVNVFLVAARSRRRRDAWEEGHAELPEAAIAARDGGLGPEGRMDLDAAIARLPDGARTAFVLHELQGYSHEEIASLTGVAAGTIRAQLFRARRRLMEMLDR
jgi:RNA polymerase sigma-70 factor (ECF subfamily)